jgi:hypothetical protein
MNAAELNEFLAAMDIVRQANMALLDVSPAAVGDDDDGDERRELAGLSISPTIH